MLMTIPITLMISLIMMIIMKSDHNDGRIIAFASATLLLPMMKVKIIIMLIIEKTDCGDEE